MLYADSHRYKLTGTSDGAFWWTVSLVRFEPGELDPCTAVTRIDPETRADELELDTQRAGERIRRC